MAQAVTTANNDMLVIQNCIVRYLFPNIPVSPQDYLPADGGVMFRNDCVTMVATVLDVQNVINPENFDHVHLVPEFRQFLERLFYKLREISGYVASAREEFNPAMWGPNHLLLFGPIVTGMVYDINA